MDELRKAQRALDSAKEGLARAVADARAQGRTWNDIGEALGMSKQAAYKRFGKPVDPQTGTPLPAHGVAGVVEVTEQVFRCIAAGDHDRLEQMMHPQTVKDLPRQSIAEVWKQVLAEVGTLEGFSDSHVELPDGTRLAGDDEVLGTVVGATLLECEAGQLVGRVAVTAEQQVVGILIVPTDHGELPF